MVPSILIGFNAIIECEVLTNTVVIQPLTTSKFTIGVDLKVSMSFAFSEFPVCGLTYSLTPALPFVTFDPNAKKIEVYSEDLEDAG
jgi:hypothetical protein